MAVTAKSRPGDGRSGEAPARRRPGDPLPLRVGFAGPEARGLLGAGVADPVDALESADTAGIDALVLGAGTDAESAPRAIDAARRAGVPVIALADGSREAGAPSAADLAVGAAFDASDGGCVFAPPADVRAYNPSRFSATGVAGYWAVAQPGADRAGIAAALEALARSGRQDPVIVRGPDEIVERLDFPDGVAPGGELTIDPAMLEFAHKRLGVIDHPSFHASDWERAGWIVMLCAAGVPVAASEPSPELSELLGSELSGLVFETRPHELADLDARERLSVAIRRVALRDHSVEARWRQICAELGIELPGRPMVSVIFATRREEWLEHGLAQIARQSYEPRELVCCLHGDGFSDGVEERVRAAVSGPVKVLRIDSELTLGDALNSGVEAAAGELVTKMDDDDYYNVDHLWDLVLACEYSGADLVGKAAEFVYLEEIDVTVRQITHDVDTRLAGGGIMLVREPLREAGGWPQRSRGEDLALIRLFAGQGRAIHRIPPHGYILNRHGRDHTWRPAVDYFLFRSERTWRGLRFDVTAIEP